MTAADVGVSEPSHRLFLCIYTPRDVLMQVLIKTVLKEKHQQIEEFPRILRQK